MVNPARHKHLRRGLDFDGFLATLGARGAEYVVLRDANGSAHAPELLIKDEHLPLAEDLVTEWPAGLPIKLFTPSARPGTGYQPPKANGHRLSPMPLFPVHRAELLIDTGMRADKRLGAKDALLARAYRAAYLQVEDWRHDGASEGWTPTPSLLTELQELSAAAGIALPQTPAPPDLDRMLTEHGWRPPVDLLEKVSSWMPWLKAVLGSSMPEPPGLLAAFIRQRAVDAGLKAQIIRHFTDCGFDPLVTFDLSPEQRRLVESSLRGGNWRIGGFPTDAGPPTTLIIAHDLLPVAVTEAVRSEQPLCDDTRIVWAKQAIRNEVNAGKPRRQHYNPVHSTDNSKQAWHVVQLLMPEREQELREMVEQRRRAFGGGSPGGTDLTRGARARVQLVEHDGGPAIRKTFRPGAERFLAREIAAMSKLAGVCAAIPKLLETGPDYLVREYVEGTSATRPWPHPLPLRTVRQMAKAVRCCVEHGFDPVGLAAGSNMVFTPTGVRFTDFEFWRECDPAIRPERSHCLAGLPEDYDGDRPPGRKWLFDPYPNHWIQHTALAPKSFLYDSPGRQRIKRSAHLATRYLKWAGRSAVRQLRSAVAGQARRRLARAATPRSA